MGRGEMAEEWLRATGSEGKVKRIRKMPQLQGLLE